MLLSADMPWARPRLWSLALLLGTLVIYFPVSRSQFLSYDDPAYVTENRVVLRGLTWPGVKWAFTTNQASNWHPLTWLSHMLDCQLFEADPGAAHLVNVGWHAANAVLFFWLLRRLSGELWTSLFAAAVFAWHPLRVESVAWVSERKDVLSVFFFLLTLLTYLRYAEKQKEHKANQVSPKQSGKTKTPLSAAASRSAQDVSSAEKPNLYYAASLMFFVLGLMSKPMLVTLPFVLLLLDFWPLRRFRSKSAGQALQALGRLAVEKWPFFLASAGACILTFSAQRTEAVVPVSLYPVNARMANAVLAYMGYLHKTVWPLALAPIYPMPQTVAWGQAAAEALLLGGITWLCWRARRTQPHLLVGWFWFVGTLVPVIGIVQVGSQAMADRYTYIPQMGLLLGLTIELQRWARQWQLRPAVCIFGAAFVLIACVWLTLRQIHYWRDGETLFAWNVAVTGDNPVAQLNLGIALEKKGSQAAAQEHYEEALRLNPALPEAHRNLGDLLNELGKTNEAIVHYRTSLRVDDNQPIVHENLGALLVKRGAMDEAMTHYARAAQLAPEDARPQYLMAKALLRQGRSREALVHFRDALQRDPDDLQTLVYAARVLAGDTDPGVRDGTEAVRMAARANELSGDDFPFMLDTLAMAYAEAGRFADALSTQQRAIDLAAASGEKDAVEEMRHRLRLYQTSTPYRENFAQSQPP